MAKKVTLPKDPKVAETFPVLIELPANIYEGIGKIITAHALLENFVSETLFDLLTIDYPEGRVAFADRAASAQFDIVRRLIELHGIKVPFDLKALDKSIEAACTARDQFAHGVWLERSGIPALRLTKGTYDTAEGQRSRATLPQGMLVDPTGIRRAATRNIRGRRGCERSPDLHPGCASSIAELEPCTSRRWRSGSRSSRASSSSLTLSDQVKT